MVADDEIDDLVGADLVAPAFYRNVAVVQVFDVPILLSCRQNGPSGCIGFEISAPQASFSNSAARSRPQRQEHIDERTGRGRTR